MFAKIVMIGVGIFLITIIICLIGIVWEMNQIDEYMDEYLEKEGQEDGCEDIFATVEEIGLHDNE